MIASGFLLGGGVLALCYPANRETLVAVQTVGAEQNATPSPQALSPEQASTAFHNELGSGSSFESIEDYVLRKNNSETRPTSASSRDWYLTSMSKPDNVTNGDLAADDIQTYSLDRTRYGNMPVENANHEPQVISEYQPFRMTTPILMPEPHPAFSEEIPSPPNLASLEQVFGTISGNVVSPSATMLSAVTVQPGIPVTGTSPVTEVSVEQSPATSPTTIHFTTITARPIMPTAETQESGRRPIGPPVVLPPDKFRDNTISAPARTVIVPN